MRFSVRGVLGLTVPGAVFLVVGFALPLIYFLRFSLEKPSSTSFAIPAVSVGNFVRFVTTSYYIHIYARTILIALAATACTLLLAMPVAYLLSRISGWLKSALVVAVLFPLLVGTVVRAIGWVALLGYSGLVSAVLTRLGVVRGGADYSHNVVAVTAALVSLLLPVMVLVLDSSLEALDPAVVRAAQDLGAHPLRAFLEVTVPRIVPGILAATSLVFVLDMNAYATPLLVGGPRVQTLATSIYSVMITDNNWPFGAAMALFLLGTSLAVTGVYGYWMRRQFQRWRGAPAA